jgi:hypothetical protein
LPLPVQAELKAQSVATLRWYSLNVKDTASRYGVTRGDIAAVVNFAHLFPEQVGNDLALFCAQIFRLVWNM